MKRAVRNKEGEEGSKSRSAQTGRLLLAPHSSPLSLSVQYAGKDAALPTRPQIRRWAAAACAGPAEITIRFVDETEGRRLNHAYRGKDYATNVLSFPYAQEPVLSGDLAICSAVVQREAAEQRKTIDAHFAHLIVHGMLHLQGYDHETSEDDAARMESMEREILNRLGYPDPYA